MNLPDLPEGTVAAIDWGRQEISFVLGNGEVWVCPLGDPAIEQATIDGDGWRVRPINRLTSAVTHAVVVK
jgi:hypothetical protein